MRYITVAFVHMAECNRYIVIAYAAIVARNTGKGVSSPNKTLRRTNLSVGILFHPYAQCLNRQARCS